MASPHKRTRPLIAVRKELPPGWRSGLWIASFLLPLVLWCVVSYVPGIWKPQIRITDPGGVTYLREGMLIDRPAFEAENAKVQASGLPPAVGHPSNPIFFPPPHRVARAFVTSFQTPPQRRGDPWLHESLLHSIRVIAWGFTLSALIGVPLGILVGTFAFFSRLIEPPVDFIRYMPAPAFGALAVAILGIHDAPKIAIIFIGTFFQMVLVVGNTTRQLDPSLLEAAQTLGATRKRLVTRVVIPGILPNLYNDLRILLGWAWTYLIVAELIGASSGISYFIYQQAKYRNYDNVYAAIVMIGMIGLTTDQFLAAMGRLLFPWQTPPRGVALMISNTFVNVSRAAQETRYGTEALRGRGASRAASD